MRPVRFVSIVAAIAIGVAGCGGSGSTAAPGSSVAGSSPTAAPRSSVAGSGLTAAPRSSVAGSSPTVKLSTAPAIGGEGCSVKISGGVTKSWQSKQASGSMLVTYWLNDSDKKLSGSTGFERFILNCESADGSAHFQTADSTTAAQFPKAPGTYVVPISTGTPGQVDLILHTSGFSTWVVAEPGTFTITTLDGSKFAGTFSVKMTNSDSGTDVSATLSGSFNFRCMASACG